MHRISFIFILLIFGLSCNQYQEKITEPDTNNDIGQVSISVSQAPDEITNVIATLSRPSYEDRVLILSISDSSQSASGEFTDVPIGMWHLKVDARDGLSVVRYRGERDVEVKPGETSVVELVLYSTTGNIEIHVTWGSKCTPLPSGIVSWWSGDGTANDIVGSNHGMLMNGASYADGKVGKAFSFDGIDDYIRIPNSPSLNPSGSFTVEAWIYPIRDEVGTIISKWGDEHGWENQRSFLVEMRQGRKIRFAISDLIHQHNATFHIFETKENIITLNNWNHVAAVYNKDDGSRQIFVNGKKIAERIDSPINIFPSIADVSIGVVRRSPTTFFPSTFFQGKIDEVAIYDRALSKKEIKRIFKSGNSGKCK